MPNDTLEISKTSYQHTLAWRLGVFSGERLHSLVRRFLDYGLTSVSTEDAGVTTVWKGTNNSASPWYWVKFQPTEVTIAAGFWSGSVSWIEFRDYCAGVLIEQNKDLKADVLQSLNSSYNWRVPLSKVTPLLTRAEFEPSSLHAFLPAEFKQLHKYSTIFRDEFDTRALLEMEPDQSEQELKIRFAFQINEIDPSQDLGKLLKGFFAQSDAHFENAREALTILAP